jgi:nickel-type superoxide dismutase maturation protease
MLPAYGPGDWLVVDTAAFRRRLPRVGEVVVARDPRHATRKLIKRVKSVDANGNIWLEGDNAGASTDSRHFGAVEQVAGLVRWRYRRG